MTETLAPQCSNRSRAQSRLQPAPKPSHCHGVIRRRIVARQRAREKQGDGVMSIVRQLGSASIERSAEAELEGKIHELVRRDSNAVRQTDSDSEIVATNLSDLLRRVSANSTGEIDNLIGELRLLREKLLADGNRVERDIVEYTSLNQSVIEMTKIITDSMLQVKKLPRAPVLAP
jgi:hypothetical protein